MKRNSAAGRRIHNLMNLASGAAVLYMLNRFIMIPRSDASMFFHDYLGDLLALPVYLPSSLFVAFKLNLVSENFEFRLFHIVEAVVLFTVIFEIVLPIIDVVSVRDPLDMLAYLAGGLPVLAVSSISRKKSLNDIPEQHTDKSDTYPSG